MRGADLFIFLQNAFNVCEPARVSNTLRGVVGLPDPVSFVVPPNQDADDDAPNERDEEKETGENHRAAALRGCTSDENDDCDHEEDASQTTLGFVLL